MKNFLSPGNTLKLIAPGGGVVSGVGYLFGSILAFAQSSEDATNLFSGLVEGVIEAPKLTANVMAVGDKVNWNDSNKEFQNAISDLDNAATVVEAADGTVSLVKVKLTPV